MAKPSFQDLWSNHPSQNGQYTPCTDSSGKPTYENQCAIRMSVALFRSGVKITTKSLRCCGKHDEPHALAVEELAAWLNASGVFGKATVYKSGVAAQSAMAGRTGIVFFKDYWARTIKGGAKEKIPSGDHIDLWNGSRTVDISGFFGWLEGTFLDNAFHDSKRFGDAKGVWFWPVT